MTSSEEGHLVLYNDILSQLRRRRPLIIVAILLLFLFYFVANYTLVDLAVTKPSSAAAAAVETLNNNGQRSGALAIGNLALIRRDTVQLSLTAGDLFTSVNVTPLPLIGIKHIDLALEQDKNADKLSGNNYGCSVYNQATGALSSFSCTNPYGLFTYSTSSEDNVPWTNKPVLNFPQAYNAVAYNGGVLGISNSSNSILFYAKEGQQQTGKLQLPSDSMSQEQLGGISVIADAANSDAPHFLLVDSSAGIVYYGEQHGDQVQYRQYAHKAAGFSPGYAISRCVLQNTSAYCYFGNSTASPESDGDTVKQVQNSDSRIVVIDFSSDTITHDTYTVDKNQPIDDIYADTAGQMYSLSNNTLYKITIENGRAERSILTTNVGSIAAGSSLYYVTNNKLYQYDSQTKTTYMRFVSKNLRLSNINLFGDTVLINAYIAGSPINTLHTYKLLDSPDTTPGQRAVDKIPLYSSTNQIDMVSMDYFRDTIHVVLPGYVKYDDKGQIVPDDTSYNDQKQVVKNYLSNAIPSFKSYKITFSRANQQ